MSPRRFYRGVVLDPDDDGPRPGDHVWIAGREHVVDEGWIARPVPIEDLERVTWLTPLRDLMLCPVCLHIRWWLHHLLVCPARRRRVMARKR